MSHDTTSSAASSEGIRFAYWVPNVSGGLVVSTIAQRTDWSLNTTSAWRRRPSGPASTTR